MKSLRLMQWSPNSFRISAHKEFENAIARLNLFHGQTMNEKIYNRKFVAEKVEPIAAICM